MLLLEISGGCFVCFCCHVEDYCRPVGEKIDGNLQVRTIVYYLVRVVSGAVMPCYPLRVSQLHDSTEVHLASNLNSFLPTERWFQQLRASRLTFISSGRNPGVPPYLSVSIAPSPFWLLEVISSK